MNAYQTIALQSRSSAAVLGMGAWLKNTACVLTDQQATFSPLHGDLSQPQARLALDHSARALLLHTPVVAIARDLHPDFYSSALAEQLAVEAELPCLAVQHLVAHIAAVQAEYGLDCPVIGLALDGVGLGSDGHVWGGEVLWLDGQSQAWQRCAHLSALALPGGDAAATQPWRLALAVLQRAPAALDSFCARIAQPPSHIALPQSSLVRQMLEKNLHCPNSTAAGRWFDAAAALLGLCYQQKTEAEAAIALERCAQQWLDANPAAADAMRSSVAQGLAGLGASAVLNLYPLCWQLLDHHSAGRIGEGAATFHFSLAQRLAASAIQAAQDHRCSTVALGGGCFFNRILKSEIQAQLEAVGLRVLSPHMVSCGDAGLALGQAWFAQKRPSP